MYFPRGWIHEARACPEEASTHITVSTYQRFTWGNLLAETLSATVNKAMDTLPALREGLPIGFLRDNGESCRCVDETSKAMYCSTLT